MALSSTASNGSLSNRVIYFSDTTGNLLNTGLVDILLPSPISEEMLDINGDFWLSAKVSCHTQNCSSIRNVYLNPVKARLEIPEEMEALISEELESFTGSRFFREKYAGTYGYLPDHTR